ncbi:TetR/AcrR family transcriptional regulator [Chitinivibrio alkaliphilus]|uniref:TetR family transcriptional regulator n=1 Tax=Chitinivibrio alkaliphilus ACht1 TaxID=1313304 RepID=U7D948_9BACT|nr:TetR/AcrR family transcriptional regulator [Chitinivibrio alkaliphilus]ERP38914.1 TetR family transcriptional regulator [Chitinivibrio alkaliphilus ACht1]
MERRKKRISKVRDMKINLILDAALKVFSECGFHDTRLEDIALEAGFSKASLYNYYEDKESIFLNVAIREYDMLFDKIGCGHLALDKGAPIEENLRRFFTTVFRSFGEHFAFILAMEEFHVFKLMSSYFARDSEKQMKDAYLKSKQDFNNLLLDIISHAQQNGEIGSSLPPERLTSLIQTLVLGTLKVWKEDRVIEREIPETVEELLIFIREGFIIEKKVQE